MKERYYTDEEVMAMARVPKDKLKMKPKPKPKEEIKYYTDEEVMAMDPIPKSSEPVKEEGGLVDSALGALSTAGEYIDRYTGAPVRKAMVEGLEKGYEQIGEPTETAPTGYQVAKHLGVPSQIPYMEEIKQFGEKYPFAINPVVANALSKIPLDKIAGLGIDIFADPMTAIDAPVKMAGMITKIKPIRAAVKSAGGRMALKEITRLSSTGRMSKALEKAPAEVIGSVIQENKLSKFLGNPLKLMEKLGGDVSTTYKSFKDPKTGKSFDLAVNVREGGKIAELSKDVDALISQSASVIPPVSMEQIASNLKSKHTLRRLDPEIAQKLDAGDMDKYEEYVDKYLKSFKGEARSIESLHKFKKDLGSQIRSDLFSAPADKSVALEKAAMLDIFHEIKRTLEESLSQIPLKNGKGTAGDLLKVKNQKLHYMMSIVDTLEQVPAKELKNLSSVAKLSNAVASGLVGIGTYALTDNPWMGFLMGGAMAERRELLNVGPMAERLTARGAETLLEGTIRGDTAINKAARGAESLRTLEATKRDIQTMDNTREPQSLPSQLISVRLPRNTQEVAQRPNLLIAKVAQQAPQHYDMLMQAKDDPEALAQILPIVAKDIPHLFERDKYNSWDGKVIDPIDQHRFREDINADESLRPHQKASIIDKFNRTKELPR